MKKIVCGAVMCAIVILFSGISISAEAKDFKKAFEIAENTLINQKGITGVSYTSGSEIITVYVQDDDDRNIVPTNIDGYPTKVEVTGIFYSCDDPDFPTEIKLTKEEFIQMQSNIFMMKPLDANHFALVNSAFRKCITHQKDGTYILNEELFEKNLYPYFVINDDVSDVYPTPLINPRTSRVRPLVGGISVGQTLFGFGAYMAGTLGIVTDQGYMLSNCHVFALDMNNNYQPIGIPIIQPGTIDFASVLNKAGSLYKYVQIQWNGAGVNYVDAAVAKATDRYTAEKVLGSDNRNTYTVDCDNIATVNVGNIVRKSGRTTGVLTNDVLSTNATITVSYGSKYAIFKDVILVDNPFSAAGDSGSVVDINGKFVGLLFAGSSSHTVVCKASRIKSSVIGGYL